MYIGPPDQQVERLSPLLHEAGFEIHRAVDAVSVLDQLWSTECGLVIANHPIGGLRLEDLLLTLRDRTSPSRHTGLVVIVGEQEYEPARMLIGQGVNRVVARRAAPQSLLCAVGDLMDQAPRMRLRAVVEMESRLDNRPTRALARTHDLSLSGMLLQGGVDLDVGSEFAFELHLPGQGTAIVGSARVVRHTDEARETVVGVGANFADFIDDGHESLAAYLKRELS
jgi:hypothetical protein